MDYSNLSYIYSSSYDSSNTLLAVLCSRHCLFQLKDDHHVAVIDPCSYVITVLREGGGASVTPPFRYLVETTFYPLSATTTAIVPSFEYKLILDLSCSDLCCLQLLWDHRHTPFRRHRTALMARIQLTMINVALQDLQDCFLTKRYPQRSFVLFSHSVIRRHC